MGGGQSRSSYRSPYEEEQPEGKSGPKWLWYLVIAGLVISNIVITSMLIAGKVSSGDSADMYETIGFGVSVGSSVMFILAIVLWIVLYFKSGS